MTRTLVKTAALFVATALGACGDSTPTIDNGCKVDTAAEISAAMGTSKVQMVVNGMFLPTSKYQFSTDLDGDGTVDNALSNLVQVLTAQGFHNQEDVATSIKTGEVVIMLEAQSTDPTLQCAAASGVTYYTGKGFPAGMLLDGGVMPDGGLAPDFSGAGSFTIDPAFPPIPLLGNISGGVFGSNAVATTAHPVTIKFTLALIGGAAPLVIPLNGARITFTSSGGKIDSNCTVAGMAGKACGAIQGSFKSADVQGLLPPIAASLTAQVQADPTSAGSKTIEGLFDLGGCTDTNGTVAKANDFIIATCELANAPLISHLLAPDVQIYDSSGNYKPVPKGTTKDSLSVGIGFTAVPGKITQ